MDPNRPQAPLESLEARLQALEDRVSKLEQCVPGADRSPPCQPCPPPRGRSRAGSAASSLFGGIALVCFSLLGALFLRIAARREWLDHGTGTALGLAYALALIALPAIRVAHGRPDRHHGAWLQYCGVVLAVSVVLETLHRGMHMTAALAAAAALTIGLVSAVAAHLSGRRLLAAFASVASLTTIAGIGLPCGDEFFRLASFLTLVGGGVLLGRRRAWPAVRIVSLVSGALLLGFAVLVTAHRPSCPETTRHALQLGLALLWVTAVAHHACLPRHAVSGEAAILPAVTLWIGPLLLFASPDQTLPAGAATTAAAWAALLAGTRLSISRARLHGFGATAVILSLMFLPRIDPTGTTLMAGAWACLLTWKHARTRFLHACTMVLALSSTTVAVTAGALLNDPVHGAAAAAGWAAILAIGLGTLWCTEAQLRHGDRAGRFPWSSAALLATMSLSAFGALRSGAMAAGLSNDWLVVAESLSIAALATCGILWGGKRSCRESLALGLIGLGLLLIKVGLLDLFALSPGQLVIDVIALGTACLVASHILKSREPACPPQENAPT